MTCLYEKLIKMAHGDLKSLKNSEESPSKPILIAPGSPVPMAQSYFSIPQDLETLENMSVLEYLEKHVWLSSRRQKKCKNVFYKLTQFIPNESWSDKVNLPYNPEEEEEDLLSMVFLGVALVDLFNFPATHQNISELYSFLDHDVVKDREMDFRMWCGISAFSERMVHEGPLRFEPLEIADFRYLKTYGDNFEISPALMRLLDVIQKSHSANRIPSEIEQIST